ncbi:MAG TPA: 50S ribosomal protein L25/general stress protein Ctc [Propionibacteriaceae bacterium]|nr:50S ribosomal protein L25/general stress protein Ctc [Propionibacteriaceae bacterium]
MAEIKLAAESRTEFGKGAARRIRRENKVPAVIYGHGTDPIHITLPGHETLLALRQANAVLTILIDGTNEQLALAKQVQRDVIRGFVKHVDLVVVRRGEKVVVDVPLHVVGDSAPDTTVNVEHQTISVRTEATHIPTGIEVSVEGLEAGTQILLGDIKLPEGTELHGDPEALAVHVTVAAVQQLETEGEATEEAATETEETPEA